MTRRRIALVHILELTGAVRARAALP